MVVRNVHIPKYCPRMHMLSQQTISYYRFQVRHVNDCIMSLLIDVLHVCKVFMYKFPTRYILSNMARDNIRTKNVLDRYSLRPKYMIDRTFPRRPNPVTNIMRLVEVSGSILNDVLWLL